MTTVGAGEAKERFSELVNRVGYGGERVVIERHGKPVAALISMMDLAFLDRVEDMLDSAKLQQAMDTVTEVQNLSDFLAEQQHGE